jgi:nucleoid-associated protein YgaU
MPRPTIVVLVRGVVGVAAVLAICAAAFRVFWAAAVDALEAVRASGPDAPADVIVVAAAAAGLALLVWGALGVVVTALAAVPGTVGRAATVVADHVAPVVVRRITAALVGGVMATAGSPVAHADTPLPKPAPTTQTAAVTHAPAPDPAFVVTDRPPVADAVPAPGPTSAPVRPEPTRAPPALGPLGPAAHTPGHPARTVTVVRGDSLWAIAARYLGPHATEQQVAREWPRWYAANRTVIGPDPDLIRVGQVLAVPGPGATS